MPDLFDWEAEGLDELPPDDPHHACPICLHLPML